MWVTPVHLALASIEDSLIGIEDNSERWKSVGSQRTLSTGTRQLDFPMTSN